VAVLSMGRQSGLAKPPLIFRVSIEARAGEKNLPLFCFNDIIIRIFYPQAPYQNLMN